MDTIGGGEVSLGDLADLTVTNDNELSCDVSSSGLGLVSSPAFLCTLPVYPAVMVNTSWEIGCVGDSGPTEG